MSIKCDFISQLRCSFKGVIKYFHNKIVVYVSILQQVSQSVGQWVSAFLYINTMGVWGTPCTPCVGTPGILFHKELGVPPARFARRPIPLPPSTMAGGLW